MNEINVEKIMEDIQKEIKEQGYDTSMPAFEEAEVNRFTVPVWDMDELESELQSVNENSYVDPSREITSTGMKKLIKKAVRKVVNIYTRPLVDDQNLYNKNIQHSLNQIYSYIQENERYKKRMNRMIQQLQEENENNKKRINRMNRFIQQLQTENAKYKKQMNRMIQQLQAENEELKKRAGQSKR